MKKLLLFAFIISAFLISCNDGPDRDHDFRTSGSQPVPQRIIPDEPKIIDIDTAFVRKNKR